MNGTEYANFQHTFPSPGLVVPPLGTKNSGRIGNVLVTKGVEAALDIIPFGVLDLLDTDADIQLVTLPIDIHQYGCLTSYFLRAATILGHLGFPVALDNLKQDGVPTT